jgi:CBS domain-containing protein
MTQRLCELPPETDVQEAAEFMLRSGIHRVLVTQDSRLVGVVSTSDVVKAVSQYGLGG